MIGPPRQSVKMLNKIYNFVTPSFLYNFKQAWNNTKEEPSFNKLSPSNNIFNLCGAPSSLNNEATAIGSVDPKTAPIIKSPTNGIFSPNPII